MDSVLYGNIPQECLFPDKNETAARLKTERGFTNELITRCEVQLRKALACAYSAVVCDVRYEGDRGIDLGFGVFESRSLFKNLNGADRAFVFAVTLGCGVDRLIARLAVTSAAEHFITDALASSFAEAACDYAEIRIKGGAVCRRRFSPGYGDLPLQLQPQVLAMVSAEKRLQLVTNKSLLMSPSKSITAIMGIVE